MTPMTVHTPGEVCVVVVVVGRGGGGGSGGGGGEWEVDSHRSNMGEF